MKMKKTKYKEIKPQTIKGKIKIGTRFIEIGSGSVGSEPGASREKLSKGLHRASKKKIFLPPDQQYHAFQ